MARGNVFAGAVDVVLRIIDEDVGTEGLQERPLVAAAPETVASVAAAAASAVADNAPASPLSVPAAARRARARSLFAAPRPA